MDQLHNSVPNRRNETLASRTAVALGVLVMAAPTILVAVLGGKTPQPETTPHSNPNPGAVALKRMLDNNDKLPLRPNVGVESRDGKTLGTVYLPFYYKQQWFELEQTGDSRQTLKFVPIEPVKLVGEQLDPRDPSVFATTQAARVTLSPLDGLPEATIHLSNGRNEQLAVGQVSANGPA